MDLGQNSIYSKDEAVEPETYVFDDVEAPEVTPNFFNSREQWNKFKINAMDTTKEQFEPAVLKQNVLNRQETKKNEKTQKAPITQFLQEEEQTNKENQEFYVANDQYEVSEDEVNEDTETDEETPQDQQEEESVFAAGTLSVPTSICDGYLTEQPLARQKQKKSKNSQEMQGMSYSEKGRHYHQQQAGVSDGHGPRRNQTQVQTQKEKGSYVVHPPEFDFYLQNGYKHLLSAKKHIISQSKTFQLSTDIGEYKKSSVIGNLMSNALHNHYLLVQEAQKPYHTVYGEIEYQKLNKLKEMRKMSVRIPLHSKINLKTALLQQFTFNEIEPICKLQLFNKDISASDYPVQSDKNFELIDAEDDFCFLRLRKEFNNIFSIEIQHPLTPLQAFSIVLTRFDAQIK